MSDRDMGTIITTLYSSYTGTGLLGMNRLSQEVVDEIGRRDNSITPSNMLELRSLVSIGFPTNMISTNVVANGITLAELDHLLSTVKCTNPWRIVSCNHDRCNTEEDIRRMKDIVTHIHTTVTPLTNDALWHIGKCGCVELTKHAVYAMICNGHVLDRKSILSITYGSKSDYAWTIVSWMLPMIGGVAALTVDDRVSLITRILLVPVIGNHNYDRVVQELMRDDIELGTYTWLVVICNNDKEWIMHVTEKYKGRYSMDLVLDTVLTQYIVHATTGQLGSILRYIVSKGGSTNMIREKADSLPNENTGRHIMLSVLEDNV